MEHIAAYLSASSAVIGLLLFLGIVWWAWSEHRKEANKESANLPFELPDEFKGKFEKKSNKDEL